MCPKNHRCASRATQPIFFIPFLLTLCKKSDQDEDDEDDNCRELSSYIRTDTTTSAKLCTKCNINICKGYVQVHLTSSPDENMGSTSG